MDGELLHAALLQPVIASFRHWCRGHVTAAGEVEAPVRVLFNTAVPVLIVAALMAFWFKPVVRATGPDAASASATMAPFDMMTITHSLPVQEIEGLN